MKKFALCLLLLIECSMLMAQNYVYSVSTGTAWADNAVSDSHWTPQEDQSDKGLIPGAPNFGKAFKQIIGAYNQANIYNDSIFYHLTHEEWISMFQRRAVAYSHFYEEDNKSIDEILDYFKQDDVPDASFDSLYFWTRHMYHRNISDVFLLEKFLNILLPHYETKQDTEHLPFCYMCAGLYQFQCARMGDKEASLRSEIYYHKVLNMRDHFTTFKDPLNHYYFIGAYVNLVILHTQAGNSSLYSTQDITHSIKRLFATPTVKEFFRKDNLLADFAQWALDLYSLRGITTYISHNTHDNKLKAQLYASYKEVKEKFGNNLSALGNNYYAKLPYDDYLIEAYMGHITWEEAVNKSINMLANDPELSAQAITQSPLEINQLNNLFETVFRIIDQSSIPTDQKRFYVKEMLSRFLNIITHYHHGDYPFEKGRILEQLAQKQEVLRYLNQKERVDLLFHLIVVEQPTTYVHVTMVADLAKELASKIIDKDPAYFLSLPNMSSIKDIRQHRDSIVHFVEQAAIYHDLGKISMPTVVNNCIRRIYEHERQILGLHPEKSHPFFSIDPSLKAYQDIALGHHKWYNGTSYPNSFDNQDSPYFSIINLVTICDCLDAATENIGRNYHHPKPFEVVLEEFKAEAGTHYDPRIIDLIDSDEVTQELLKKIVQTGRYDHYYKMYTGYMSNK